MGSNKKKSYAKLADYGPAGGSEGTSFDDRTTAINLAPEKDQYSPGIAKLIIRSGEILDSIQAIYADENGDLYPPDQQPDQHGGTGGGEHTVELATAGDYITEISGYYGQWDNNQYILQITLKTIQGKTYGPYGTMQGSANQTPFKFPTQDMGDGRVLSFSGRTYKAPQNATVLVTALGATFVFATA